MRSSAAKRLASISAGSTACKDRQDHPGSLVYVDIPLVEDQMSEFMGDRESLAVRMMQRARPNDRVGFVAIEHTGDIVLKWFKANHDTQPLRNPFHRYMGGRSMRFCLIRLSTAWCVRARV